MIKTGQIQTLKVLKKVDFGVYLIEKEEIMNPFFESSDPILLPRAQVPVDLEVDDTIEVFIYRDSEDRRIATVNKPLITTKEVACLEVVHITPNGAFLNMGLEKDVFLPMKEQISEIKIGQKYPVKLYVDHTDRLCVTMNIYNELSTDHDFEKGDTVKGVIYQVKDHMGALVCVENKYHGMIPIRELFGDYTIGEYMDCTIIKVREDNKLELSIRKKTLSQMDDDSKIIMEALTKADGFLPYNDKTDPSIIKNELKMSKRSFKRSIGKLYKERKIQIKEDGIHLV